jgi:integrase/recombinase XerD
MLNDTRRQHVFCPLRAPELFLNAQGRVMTREGFAYVLRKYVRLAAPRCPSLAATQVTPHVLRHTCAMMILQATGDLRKVSLWLGHAAMQTTEVYLRAGAAASYHLLPRRLLCAGAGTT